MQCTEFQQRMNDLLDRREMPECDPPLRFHAIRDVVTAAAC